MNVGSKSGAIVVAGIITMAAHASAHAQEAKRLEEKARSLLRGTASANGVGMTIDASDLRDPR